MRRVEETGAYAEYIVVSTQMLLHKPKKLPWEEAAGIPEVTFYLWMSLSYPKADRD